MGQRVRGEQKEKYPRNESRHEWLCGRGSVSPAGGAPEPLRTLRISDVYTAFPRQKEFHESTAKYRLFGGAAGPGKTKALLWEAIRQAHDHARIDTLLLRRTFPELETSLLSYFRRDVPREMYASYNDSKHVVTWLNGSTTRFGYSASESDIYQYQGAEFTFIGIDELTLFTLGQWQFLTSRNRCTHADVQPNMAGATNPGNIGHAWVKALWVDKRPAPGMDRPGQYDPADYAFIRATLADNPLYKDDADYLKTLDALPRHLRQAFLVGDWNVFAGQYFDLFDVRRHTARAERLGIETWWPRWISVDWGFEHPSAVYWHAARPDGAVLTYREFVANHLSPRMLGQAIAERSLDAEGRFERIAEVYLSPDAYARRSSESTIAEQLGDVLAQNGLPRPARRRRRSRGRLDVFVPDAGAGAVGDRRFVRAADRVLADADARSGECRGCAEVEWRRSRGQRAVWAEDAARAGARSRGTARGRAHHRGGCNFARDLDAEIYGRGAAGFAVGAGAAPVVGRDFEMRSCVIRRLALS